MRTEMILHFVLWYLVKLLVGVAAWLFGDDAKLDEITPITMQWILWSLGLDAIDKGDPHTLNLLFETTVFQNQFTPADQRDLLNHFATVFMTQGIASGRFESLANVLLAHGADAQSLHLSSLTGTVETVRFLGRHGALGMEIKNLFRGFAWADKDESYLRTLIEQGVDPRASGANVWHHMMAFGSWRATKLVIDEWYVDVDTRRPDAFEWTPLMCAAVRENMKCLQLLLDQNADLTLKDSSGRTALANAAKRGNYVAVELLLCRGADPNQQDGEGKTALDHAIERQHGAPDIVQLLLRHGAHGHHPNAKRQRI